MKNENCNELRKLNAQLYFLLFISIFMNSFTFVYFNDKCEDLKKEIHTSSSVEEVIPYQTNYSEMNEYYIPIQTVEVEADIVPTLVAVDVPEPQKITNDFDILKPCGYSREQLEYMLSYDSYKNLLPHLDTFILAEKKYGVNSLYLICKCGLESGWGSCPSGRNNIGGWKNDNGKYRNFASEDECILYVAEALSTTYQDSVGTRLIDVCKRYSTTPDYAYQLKKIMIQRQSKIQEMKETS